LNSFDESKRGVTASRLCLSFSELNPTSRGQCLLSVFQPKTKQLFSIYFFIPDYLAYFNKLNFVWSYVGLLRKIENNDVFLPLNTLCYFISYIKRGWKWFGVTRRWS